MGKMKFKKLLTASVLFGTAAFSFGTLVACAPNNNLVQNITTYSTNDVHGRMPLQTYNDDYKGQKSAGLESIAGYLQTYNNYDLLFDVGDLIQGNALTNHDKGKTIFDIVNRMKYDAIAVGNHEFDFGYEHLLELDKASTNTKFMGANVKYEGKDDYLFDQHHLIKKIKDNLTVGITAVTTEETKYTTHPKNVKGLEFTDIVQETKKEVDEMKKEGAEMIVVLTHTGEEDATKIANALGDEVDLIIDGHSHIRYEKQVNNTWIVQTGSNADGLRKSTFNFNKKTKNIENFKTEVLSYETLAAENEKAPKEIKDSIAKLSQELDAAMSTTVIENLPYTLNGDSRTSPNKETNLGDFSADSFYVEASKGEKKVDLAVMNSGGIRTSIEKGLVVKKEVVDVFPFGNNLVTVDVPGDKLYEAFEYSVKNMGAAMLQVSEQVKIEADIEEVNGETIKTLKSVKIMDQETRSFTELSKEKTYTLATIDFITSGGDGYTMLDASNPENGISNIEIVGNDLEALLNYLQLVYKDKDMSDSIVQKYQNQQNRLIYKNINSPQY